MAVTPKPAEEATEPKLAVMLACPAVKLIARPPAPMVATPVDEELQSTVFVRSCVRPLR